MVLLAGTAIGPQRSNHASNVARGHRDRTPAVEPRVEPIETGFVDPEPPLGEQILPPAPPGDDEKPRLSDSRADDGHADDECDVGRRIRDEDDRTGHEALAWREVEHHRTFEETDAEQGDQPVLLEEPSDGLDRLGERHHWSVRRAM